MESFIFNTPTKVAFGKDAVEHIGQLVKEQGCKKVLIHYYGGEGGRILAPLVERVEKALDAEGVEHIGLGGVVANPHLGLAREGIELCRKEGVDFLLAVGGGSVIDSAKCIGYGLANEGDVWDFYTNKRVPAACYPVGVVLTMAATGSEMSNSSVITDEATSEKRFCDNDVARPKFAIMDPQITMTLPDYQTASGCADIMMHTMERYFTSVDPTMEITDSIAEALMRTVMKYALVLRDDPKNYEARAEIMWASSLSHNGLTGCGTDGGDWQTHRIEHELGGFFNVAHGAGLTAVWGAWARYVWKGIPKRFYKFAVNVMGVEAGEEEATVLAGIEAAEKFFLSINMPVTIRGLGIDPTDDDLKKMAKSWSEYSCGEAGSAMKLHEEDVLAIYRNALG